MEEGNKYKEPLNPVADRVEKRTKEIFLKSERLVTDGLDILEDFLSRLLEVRPREYKPLDYKPRELTKKESRDEE